MALEKITGMNPFLNDDTNIEIAQPFRLQWEQAQKKYILLYPEGMIQLNQTAGMILNLCCLEQKTVGQTVTKLSQEFGDPADDSIVHDVHEFLKVAYGNQWIKERIKQ